VQFDPIKPMLKAPGTKRLKLNCDETLSSFAFNFNLRCHTKDGELAVMSGGEDGFVRKVTGAGRARHTLFANAQDAT